MDIYVYKFRDETSGLLAYMKLGVVLCTTIIIFMIVLSGPIGNHSYCPEFK